MELYGEYITKFNGSNFGIGEPIVRCRDCAKADWVAAIGHGGFTCQVHGWTSDSVDKFCAWSERKSDKEL